MKTQSLNFKKEWNAEDFKIMEQAIRKHFAGVVKTMHNPQGVYIRTFKQLDNLLGLAYTSSSKCAMYGICNTEVKRDEHTKYEYFAISEEGQPFAVCWDKNEKETLVPLFPPPLFKVYRVFRKSNRKQIIERGLTREEAKRLVNSFPDSNTSMVVFSQQ